MPAAQTMNFEGRAVPYSQQHLVNVSDSSAKSSEEDISDPKVDLLKGSPLRVRMVSGGARSVHAPVAPTNISAAQWATVFILFFVNLINYMDRLTIAGILSKIQNEYQIDDAKGGALQTVFVLSYMVFAPMFGYLGDRHSRKLLMAFGVFFWTIFTLIGSFMPDYTWFLVCRAMVGIGEASYSTIAPTIISDMFVKEDRSKMLTIFYFAIPLGSGLGYVVGSETTNLAGGDWRWGLRVTPILGLIAVILILLCLKEPERGEVEGHCEMEATTYVEDLKSLAGNRSFVLSTLAFTCVTFCTGALSWWGPKYIEAAVASSFQEGTEQWISVSSVSFVFGVVTLLSGVVGLPLGFYLSKTLRPKNKRSDPIICAVGLFLSAGFLAVGMVTANKNIPLTFTLLFLGEVMLNLNWAIVADILLYVVVPIRRSTAEAVQILISHALGDAGSPYVIGLITDSLRVMLPTTEPELCDEVTKVAFPDVGGIEAYSNKTVCDFTVDYYSMQYSLFINNIVEVVGSLFFLLTAIYVVKDMKKCSKYISEHKPDGSTVPIQVLSESSSSISADDDEEPPKLRLILPSDDHV